MTALEDVTTSTTGSVTGLTTTVEPALLHDLVLRSVEATRRRWRDPRIGCTGVGPASVHLTVGRPLEWPTRIRVTWRVIDGRPTEVRLAVRHIAGLSGASRRLVERFVQTLALQLDTA